MQILVLKAVLFCLIALTIYLYILYRIDKKIKEETAEDISIYKRFGIYLRGIKEGYFSYTRIEKYLRRLGNPFELTPVGYVAGKILISIILMLSFIISGAYIQGIIAAVFGYFLIDIIMILKDKEDMKKIKFDLKNVYDSLIMQIAAGTSIGTALIESYLIASNKRLKKSLAVLTAEIIINHNVDNALTNFESRFNSDEIGSFVMALKQSILTGQSKQQLEDLSEQLSEINLITVQDSTKRIDSVVTVIELLLFVGILITTLYLTGQEIIHNMTGIFTK